MHGTAELAAVLHRMLSGLIDQEPAIDADEKANAYARNHPGRLPALEAVLASPYMTGVDSGRNEALARGGDAAR